MFPPLLNVICSANQPGLEVTRVFYPHSAQPKTFPEGRENVSNFERACLNVKRSWAPLPVWMLSVKSSDMFFSVLDRASLWCL